MQEARNKGIDFVIRLPRCKFKEAQDFVNSTNLDQGCQIQRKKSDSPMQLRLVRYRVKRRSYLIITSLYDTAKFPRRSIRDLYHQRWGVEEFFKSIKQEGRIEEFRSKSKNGIMQEIFTFLLIHSLNRIIEIEAEERSSRTYLSNHRLASSAMIQLLPKLIKKNVQLHTIARLIENIHFGRYKSYGGRHFPRISYKPSSKWRRTRKLSVKDTIS